MESPATLASFSVGESEFSALLDVHMIGCGVSVRLFLRKKVQVASRRAPPTQYTNAGAYRSRRRLGPWGHYLPPPMTAAGVGHG